MEAMATVHISEAELARDVRGALAKVQQGLEIVIEREYRTIAVLRARCSRGRPILEILREVRRRWGLAGLLRLGAPDDFAAYYCRYGAAFKLFVVEGGVAGLAGGFGYFVGPVVF
jgi:hypothetical protein